MGSLSEGKKRLTLMAGYLINDAIRRKLRKILNVKC